MFKKKKVKATKIVKEVVIDESLKEKALDEKYFQLTGKKRKDIE